MTDRYQPLRNAIAAGAVLVALKRPEGYEDAHPELMIDDATIHPAFEPEHVSAEVAALLAERDALRQQLFHAVAEIEVWSLYAPRHVREAQGIDDVLERHRAVLAKAGA